MFQLGGNVEFAKACTAGKETWRLCEDAPQQVLIKFILAGMPVNNPHNLGKGGDRVGSRWEQWGRWEKAASS